MEALLMSFKAILAAVAALSTVRAPASALLNYNGQWANHIQCYIGPESWPRLDRAWQSPGGVCPLPFYRALALVCVFWAFWIPIAFPLLLSGCVGDTLCKGIL